MKFKESDLNPRGLWVLKQVKLGLNDAEILTAYQKRFPVVWPTKNSLAMIARVRKIAEGK